MDKEFWKDETCEYCGGKIREKIIDLPKKVENKYVLVENVPAGVCTECGSKFYTANVLKTIEETVHGRTKAKKEFSMPVFSY